MLRMGEGIVGLADKWTATRVDAACERALHFGDPSCRRIKAILSAGTDLQPIHKVVQLQLMSFTFARGAADFFTKEELFGLEGSQGASPASPQSGSVKGDCLPEGQLTC